MQRIAGQGQLVALVGAIVERERGDGQDMRCGGIDDERLIELDARDRLALGTEPTLLGELAEVKAGQCRLDAGAGRSA
jgi:hypothetical protein